MELIGRAVVGLIGISVLVAGISEFARGDWIVGSLAVLLGAILLSYVIGRSRSRSSDADRS